MRKIEFVSYDGKFPNYCHGTLVLSVDGEKYSFKNAVYHHTLVIFDEDDNIIDQGDNFWDIEEDWASDMRNHTLGENKEISFSSEEINRIYMIANMRIPCYHCGGCL